MNGALDAFEIRPYRNTDQESLVRAWNACLPHDVLTRERFMDRVILDVNFDAELAPVAIADGEVAAFCLGMRRRYPYLTRGLEPERGWICALFTEPGSRRIGLASKLVDWVEGRLAELGIREVTVGAYSPNYFMPGIDLSYDGAVPFFESLGYDDRGKAVSMQRSLFGYELPQATRERIGELRGQGILFEPYQGKYLDRLLTFAGEQFGAGWLRNVMDALRAHEAEQTILLAVDSTNDEILGFCMRKIDGNDARFGPIGVREDMRSQGLGGVLLDLQMLEMKKRGITGLYFLWTSGTNIRFYEKHGFSTYRTYRLSRKRIGSTAGEN